MKKVLFSFFRFLPWKGWMMSGTCPKGSASICVGDNWEGSGSDSSAHIPSLPSSPGGGRGFQQTCARFAQSTGWHSGGYLGTRRQERRWWHDGGWKAGREESSWEAGTSGSLGTSLGCSAGGPSAHGS